MRQDKFQERRQLPRRASRGVRAQQGQQERKQDDQVYNRLFGNLDDSQESDQSFSQQLGLRPLQTFSANFANYNYGRGYHYFFNLDTFPRVEGSPSYALDDMNRFKHTFSHDQQVINGSQIKKLINRHLIGLPTSETTFGNTKSQDKNVCHYHLFNIEDKKYYNSRLITKYRYILKNLEKLQQQNKLKWYTQLKKDVVMYEVCQKNTSIERKRQVLQNRIKVLEQRVLNMSPYWDWQDGIYYHFSLDQIFHNQALAKGQRLSVRNLKQRIFNKINSRKQFISSISQGSVTLGAQKPKIAVEEWLIFQQQNRSGVSKQIQNELKNSIKLIEMFIKKEELILFPLFLFNLGNADRAVDSLLKAKLQKKYESQFYIYKSFIKKLFRRQLLCQQQSLNEPMLMQQYTKIMKAKLANIRQFYDDQQQKKEQNQKQSPIIIDQLIQIEKIQTLPIQQHTQLLRSQNKIEISIKQLMLLFFYRNISIALTKFIDYINKDPEIIKLMADSNYQKYHYGVANILHQHQFCILLNDIQRLAQVLYNCDVAPQFNQTLYFNFDKNLRVGYVWSEKQSDEWQTQKQDNDQQDNDEQLQDGQDSMRDVFDNGDPKPSKKVKLDQQ